MGPMRPGFAGPQQQQQQQYPAMQNMSGGGYPNGPVQMQRGAMMNGASLRPNNMNGMNMNMGYNNVNGATGPAQYGYGNGNMVNQQQPQQQPQQQQQQYYPSQQVIKTPILFCFIFELTNGTFPY